VRQDDLDAAIRQAARQIVHAFDNQPDYVRTDLAFVLYANSSETLSAIGGALLSGRPVSELARSLPFEIFLGDAEEVAARLGDSLPWSMVRSALEGAVAAWRLAHPGLRTRFDRDRRLAGTPN
jgi:hypothetical protein